MNILVIGEQQHVEELREKFGTEHQYTVERDHREAERYIASNDLVFDFILDEEPLKVEVYMDKAHATVFINTAKISLAELSNITNHAIKAQLFGFNGLPTFVNRPILEASILKKEDEPKLAETCKTLLKNEDKLQLTEICNSLNTDFLIVDDRVGMVTPRVICMIINEAYFTVQEGTATREDIDMAMKLGTNYPYGPFEWCARIGIKHVYELLEAVYEDTHDERYKICSLLISRTKNNSFNSLIKRIHL
jgi:3-hydroxybutyryl-CoA dehydrogenase